MRNILLAAALLCIATTTPAMATDPDQAVEARQNAFKEMGAEMRNLNALIKGNVEKDRAAITESAQKILKLSNEPWAYFTPDTTITRLNHKASPSIWSDPAGFRAAQAKFIGAAQALAHATPKGAEKDLKKLAEDLSASCMACHLAYRN